MSPTVHPGKRVPVLWLAAALLVGSNLPGAAVAEDGPIDSLLRGMDLKTDAGRAPDFVEQSRPSGDSDFMPIGTQHPDRPLKVKTPAELKAAEAALDAARMRHDKIAGRKPPPETKPGPSTSAAGTVPKRGKNPAN